MRTNPACMRLLRTSTPKCQYLLCGDSVGQNLISLWQRGQNFIFPVHEPQQLVQLLPKLLGSEEEPTSDHPNHLLRVSLSLALWREVLFSSLGFLLLQLREFDASSKSRSGALHRRRSRAQRFLPVDPPPHHHLLFSPLHFQSRSLWLQEVNQTEGLAAFSSFFFTPKIQERVTGSRGAITKVCLRR